MVWVARWSRFDEGRVEEGVDGYEVSTTVLLRLGQFYSRYDTILAYTRLLDAFCTWSTPYGNVRRTNTHSSLDASQRFSPCFASPLIWHAHRSFRFLSNSVQARKAGLPGCEGRRASRGLQSRRRHRELHSLYVCSYLSACRSTFFIFRLAPSGSQDADPFDGPGHADI
jgi:hypothetical protein